ncbi:MAG: chorismate synthase [Candidatus Caldatribacteriaceae bacterium]
MALEFHTAGESHGKGISVFVSGFPAGLELDIGFIKKELARRRRGVGVSPRMSIEEDEVEVLGGLRWGKTLGGPVVFLVKNSEYEKWKKVMDPEGQKPEDYEPVTIPRPGHADLGGMIKYRFDDIRNVIERASARETVGRCIAGAMAKMYLRLFGVEVGGFVESIGGVQAFWECGRWREILQKASLSPLSAPERTEEMERRIHKAVEEGDTLGGTFIVVALGAVPGLGSYHTYCGRLDALLAFYFVSIPGVKGVEVGEGFRSAKLLGSEVHDEIWYDASRSPFPFYRKTNRGGGIEGGISTGEAIWVRCAMKPIPTLRQGLHSVDVISKRDTVTRYERSDVCAVPRALVVGEAMLSWVLACAYAEKFGGDSVSETLERFQAYVAYLEHWKG